MRQESGWEMTDGISRAALSAYFFIIQRSISVPLTVTQSLHPSPSLLHNLPPHIPRKCDKPQPLTRTDSPHLIHCFFFPDSIARPLRKTSKALCFFCPPRPCLNIDRDWKPRWLLSHITEGQGWQSFHADFIRGAENCKYGSMRINGPGQQCLHYPPACLTPCNLFQWRWRFGGDGV